MTAITLAPIDAPATPIPLSAVAAVDARDEGAVADLVDDVAAAVERVVGTDHSVGQVGVVHVEAAVDDGDAHGSVTMLHVPRGAAR